MRRAAPVACLVTALWAVPSLASADPPANAPAQSTADAGSSPAADTSSTHWAPIVWACVGVLFGGVLAVWQIRGLKRSR
jgi:hypothetical protein